MSLTTSLLVTEQSILSEIVVTTNQHQQDRQTVSNINIIDNTFMISKIRSQAILNTHMYTLKCLKSTVLYIKQ